jgi:hypothetical protein
MPHNGIHAVQEHFSQHHAQKDNGHVHNGHPHHQHTEKKIHPLQLDVVSYYKDFLHVDLKKAEFDGYQYDLNINHVDTSPFTLALLPDTDWSLYSNLSDTVPPPDIGQYLPYNLPLYLSTQRFRL